MNISFIMKVIMTFIVFQCGHAALKEKVASIKGGRGGDARVCGYCGAPGHTEAYCHKKQSDEAAKKAAAEA